MRNFAERRAEVFRRSETRIRERKTARKRLLVVSIPLCLTVVIGSALVLPIGQDGITEDAGNTNGACVQAEVNGNGIVVTQNSEAIVQIIEDAFAPMDELYQEYGATTTQTMVQTQTVPGNFSQSDDVGAITTYTVTVTADDGEKTVYILTGRILLNQATGQQAVLTEQQRADLLAALGL